jgi:colanic acid biosynthesis glycosyl transferase WcaI
VRAGRRPHLLVLNQYYAPGVEATAHLLTELCEALAQAYDVTVITGRLLGHESEPDYECRNGVEVIRVHSTAFDRSGIFQRAVNYFTYLGRALRRGLVARRPDLVLCMTDPPMVGDVGYIVSRRFRVPLVVVSQDVFPEIAVHVRRLRNPLLVWVLDVLVRFHLRRADRVVAIGETMRRRLEAKGVRHERIRVIPNWVDTNAIAPQPRENAWGHSHGLDGRFVVMHSGNIGHAQDLETLVRAAKDLDDVEELSVVLVGLGPRRAHHERLAAQIGARRVRFLDHQPRALLPQSLSSADVHFVGLGRGLSGYVVPSRLYGILAAGRPVLVGADDDSETAALVREVGCGVVVPPGEPDLVAQAIREMLGGEYDLADMGRRARDWAEENAGRELAIDRYRALLADVLRSSGSRS